MSLGARLLNLVVIGGILLFGLLLLLLAVGHHVDISQSRQLVESGAQTEAVVTQVFSRRNQLGYSYRFAVAGRDFEVKKRSIPYSMRNDFRVGDKVRVWYDPTNPARNVTTAHLVDMESWWSRLSLPVLGIGLVALAVTLMRRKPQRR